MQIIINVSFKERKDLMIIIKRSANADNVSIFIGHLILVKFHFF